MNVGPVGRCALTRAATLVPPPARTLSVCAHVPRGAAPVYKISNASLLPQDYLDLYHIGAQVLDCQGDGAPIDSEDACEAAAAHLGHLLDDGEIQAPYWDATVEPLGVTGCYCDATYTDGSTTDTTYSIVYCGQDGPATVGRRVKLCLDGYGTRPLRSVCALWLWEMLGGLVGGAGRRSVVAALQFDGN